MTAFKGLFYGVVLAVGFVCLELGLGATLGWYGLGVGFALGSIGAWMANLEDRS